MNQILDLFYYKGCIGMYEETIQSLFHWLHVIPENIPSRHSVCWEYWL